MLAPRNLTCMNVCEIDKMDSILERVIKVSVSKAKHTKF